MRIIRWRSARSATRPGLMWVCGRVCRGGRGCCSLAVVVVVQVRVHVYAAVSGRGPRTTFPRLQTTGAAMPKGGSGQRAEGIITSGNPSRPLPLALAPRPSPR